MVQKDMKSVMRDAGVPVVFGGVTAYGTLNSTDEAALSFDHLGGMIGTHTVLDLPMSVHPTITHGSAITVGGVNYICREKRLAERGTINRLLLGAAS